jgi:hypothetical protein
LLPQLLLRLVLRQRLLLALLLLRLLMVLLLLPWGQQLWAELCKLLQLLQHPLLLWALGRRLRPLLLQGSLLLLVLLHHHRGLVTACYRLLLLLLCLDLVYVRIPCCCSCLLCHAC